MLVNWCHSWKSPEKENSSKISLSLRLRYGIWSLITHIDFISHIFVFSNSREKGFPTTTIKDGVDATILVFCKQFSVPKPGSGYCTLIPYFSLELLIFFAHILMKWQLCSLEARNLRPLRAFITSHKNKNIVRHTAHTIVHDLALNNG